MRFPPRCLRIGFSFLVLAALGTVPPNPIARAADPASERADKLRGLMRTLPDGAVVLYVLGDLNEDERVTGGFACFYHFSESDCLSPTGNGDRFTAKYAH